MIKFFKKIFWLVKNQEKIEKLLESKKVNAKYSAKGVPDFQRDYVNELIGTK